MKKMTQHPILPIPKGEICSFEYQGVTVQAQKGQCIASALHQAGFPIHSHSIKGRERSLECGIGKCGACEMWVDGQIRRICVSPVDGVKEVRQIVQSQDAHVRLHRAEQRHKQKLHDPSPVQCMHTTVAIIGAGPAGLAVREELLKQGVHNLVIDANAAIGGQFLMQTHAFFFFEKEKRFGGMRGFDIAQTLAGESQEGILLRCTVWDILEGKRLAVKNLDKEEVFYIDCDYVVVATGALPFMPAFGNDDLPGVYTAAVFQKMMNSEFTLLGQNILTVGAGNIGYLTSYQAFQAGANVKAIIEAAPQAGGFPVQRNRVCRIGIPICTAKTIVKAIPNAEHTGIVGAVVADCENFKALPGTEQYIDGIDVINICTGLLPDHQLLTKGKEAFGERCMGVGDAVRIGEGTSAVLRGRQCAYEILQDLGISFPYDTYLSISKSYIDSQQKPIQIKETAHIPEPLRRKEKPFVIIDCLYGFACNPCSFACSHGAITKTSTSTTPEIDDKLCVGCMDCVTQCPGLAIFGFDLEKQKLFLPFEYELEEGQEVFLVNTQGEEVATGKVEKIIRKKNLTHLARIACITPVEEDLFLSIRGFVREPVTHPLFLGRKISKKDPLFKKGQTFICHCDDVTVDEVLEQIGGRKFISIDEIKHTTHLGMGPCRGKRCIPRLKIALRAHGIEITGEVTPRAPLSNPVQIGELMGSPLAMTQIFPKNHKEINVRTFIAGGGMAGSSLFRYMSEAKMYPLLANTGRGSSWRNLAGGRPAFSVPELADIARHNMELFKDLNALKNIDFKTTRYVSFAHDTDSYQALEKALAWSHAYMVDPKDFKKEISPYIASMPQYIGAQISQNCWQATPGKTIDLLREIGKENGGVVLENCEVLSVEKTRNHFMVWVKTHYGEYVRCRCDYFVNAMGADAEKFCQMLGYQTGMYAVKHQAFITRRLPMLGLNGDSLDMLIDRRTQKGFSAIYGQQLRSTGQILLCASPAVDAQEAGKNLKLNSQEFIEYTAQSLLSWLPSLRGEGFQASWAGYYTEPRYIVDPQAGLFVGMRGHGFMLSMYLAKMFTDTLAGKEVPSYFKRLALEGDALKENAFK